MTHIKTLIVRLQPRERKREQRQLPNFNMVIKHSLKLMKPLISKTEAGMVTNHGFILT